MAIQTLQRNFKFKDEILPDPNAKWSEKEVKQFYATQYPELVNASIEESSKDDNVITYEFKTNLGTKG
jgi:PRTRC genetic system protein C